MSQTILAGVRPPGRMAGMLKAGGSALMGTFACLMLSSAAGAQTPCTVSLVPDVSLSSEDNTAVINVTGNDNLCTANYVILPLSQPLHGSVTIGSGNVFNFTPAANFSGCTGFQYAVNSNPEPTTANKDAAATLVNTAVTIAILNNDTDPQNDPLTPSITTGPANGTAVLNANKTVTYTPASGYSGSDQFTYTISDGNGNTSTTQVAIDVRFSNPGTVHHIPPKYYGSQHANTPTQLWINTESPAGASGTITFGQGVPIPFTVGASGTYIMNMTSPAVIGQMSTLNTVNSTAGITVQADVPVNVQVIQENSIGQSALTSKAEVGLGTQFFAGQMGMTDSYEGGGRSVISVLATQPNTSVTITRPPGAAWNWDNLGAGSVTVTLQAGESYMVGISNPGWDMTGSTVTATKPVSVASGSFGARFINGGGAVDNGWDQMVPVNKVGSSYVIINSNSSPDVTDFIATQNGTTISVNGVSQGTFNAGQYYRLNLTADLTLGTTRKVTSSAPVYALLNTGRDLNRAENGLVLVAPINPSGRGTFRFRTPQPGNNTAPIALLTNTSSMSSLKVYDVTGGGNVLVVNGPAGTAVASDPTLSVFLTNLSVSREYKVTCDAFVQLSIIGATSGSGGAISYFGGFEPSNTVAANDNITIAQNNARTFSPLNNDVDGNGDPLTITNVSTPANGTATFNAANGTITYTPNTNYTGSDVFSYTITDGNFNFSTAQVNISVQSLPTSTVTIRVAPVPDNPNIVASDATAQIPAAAAAGITIGTSADNDGSETLGTSVTISGVPASLTFSAGTNNSNGTWTIPVASLSGLTATSTAVGSFAMTASVSNSDNAGCDFDNDGNYEVVTSSFSDAFTLTFTCPTITFTATPTAEVCPGAQDGAISVTGINGGFAPYTYSIDGGTSFTASSAFAGLAPGSYNVQVKDGNGCPGTMQATTVAAGSDLIHPTVSCRSSYVITLASGTGSISPSDLELTPATDNCGILGKSLSMSAFGCSNAGNVYPVVLTVTDNSNNSSVCTTNVTVNYKPTCSIAVTPGNTTFTGDSDPTHIYLGYGPQSANIVVTPAGGGSGYTYSWTGTDMSYLSANNVANPSFAPTAAGNYSYTVTVTNSNGCSTTCQVSFCVLDIRVPGTSGNSQKVYICHVPNGNPANANTLSVSVNAVASHLTGHAGDRLGACDQSCGTTQRRVGAARNELGDEVKVYPNPNRGTFIIELPHVEDQAVISIIDMAGKRIMSRTIRDGDGNKISMNLADIARGMYYVEVVMGDRQFRTRLVIR